MSGVPPALRRAAFLLLLAPLLLAPLTTAGATEAALELADPQPALVISEITPAAPGPGSTISVRGTVRSPAPLAPGTTVAVRVGRSPLGSRTQLDRHSNVPAAAGRGDARIEVPAGVTEAPFSLEIAADSLSLRGFGVYPLSVTATGPGLPATTVGTYLPWTPANAGVAPTRFVWLWPLIDQPHRDPEGAFFDRSLVESLQNGRLARLLELPRSGPGAAPVTWVVDPQLLEDVRELRDGYRVRSGPPTAPVENGPVAGTAEPSPDASQGPEVEVAARWLAAYDAAVGSAPAFTVPYADPDISAVARAGQVQALARAKDRAHALLRGPADSPAPRTAAPLAWPADGLLTPEGADAAAATGIRTFVLQAAALPAGEILTYTSDAHTAVSTPSGPATVLVPDPVLSELVSRPTRDDGGNATAALIRQRFLAETAMVTAERPSDSRTVVIAPPHRWNVQSTVTAELLTLIEGIPWMNWTTVGEVAASTEAPTLSELVYPATAAGAELPAGHLSEVADFEADARELGSMVQDDGEMLDGYLAYGLRLRSAALREAPAAPGPSRPSPGPSRGEALLAGRQLLDQYQSGVRIVSSPVTLGASDGPIPVTVVNDLSVPVRVRVELAPRGPRLLVQDIPEVTVAAGRKAQVNVPSFGLANGAVVVDAQLRTPTGYPLGSPVPIPVGITNVGAWGTYLTVGGAVMFILAALVRGLRRFRASRASAAGDVPASI